MIRLLIMRSLVYILVICALSLSVECSPVSFISESQSSPLSGDLLGIVMNGNTAYKKQIYIRNNIEIIINYLSNGDYKSWAINQEQLEKSNRAIICDDMSKAVDVLKATKSSCIIYGGIIASSQVQGLNAYHFIDTNWVGVMIKPSNINLESLYILHVGRQKAGFVYYKGFLQDKHSSASHEFLKAIGCDLLSHEYIARHVAIREAMGKNKTVVDYPSYTEAIQGVHDGLINYVVIPKSLINRLNLESLVVSNELYFHKMVDMDFGVDYAR